MPPATSKPDTSAKSAQAASQAETAPEDAMMTRRGERMWGETKNTAIEPSATGQSLALVPTRMYALHHKLNYEYL